jgi:hypothetical protein
MSHKKKYKREIYKKCFCDASLAQTSGAGKRHNRKEALHNIKEK